MLSSPIIDLVIGLMFVFGATAALASLVTELIARLAGLRGAYLLSGLRELVDGGGSSTDLADMAGDYQAMRDLMQPGPVAPQQPPPASPSAPKPSPEQPSPEQPSPEQASPEQASPEQASPAEPPSATGALLGGPILTNQGVAGRLSTRKLVLGPTRGTGRLPKMTAGRKTGGVWNQCRSLPSYISATSFAEAVIDLVAPGPQGQTTMTTIEQNLLKLPAAMPFRQSLEALARNAGDDVGRFRASVEQWYDDHMDRVSGWYKRHVAMITLAAGAIFVVLLNLNALTIGRTLYTENVVSAAISTVAAKATACSGGSEQDCLASLEGQLSAAATAGLPVGWGTVRDCTEPNARCNWLDQRGVFSRHGDSGWQLVLVLAGFLIMIVSIVPGAQFWFGLLSKLGTLRATGPKPATAP